MRPSLPCPSQRNLLAITIQALEILELNYFHNPVFLLAHSMIAEWVSRSTHPGLAPVVGSPILPQFLLLPSQPLASGTFTVKQMKSPRLCNAPLPTPNPNKAQARLGERARPPELGKDWPGGKSKPVWREWPELRGT